MSAAAAASASKGTPTDAERMKALAKELGALRSKAKQQKKLESAAAKEPPQTQQTRATSPRKAKESTPEPQAARPQVERVKDAFMEALTVVAGAKSVSDLTSCLHESEQYRVTPTRFRWLIATEAMGKIPKTQTLGFKLVKTTASAEPDGSTCEVTIGDYHMYHTAAPTSGLIGYIVRKNDSGSQGYWVIAEASRETSGFTWGLVGDAKRVSFQELVTANKVFSGFGTVESNTAKGGIENITCVDIIKKMKDARNGDVAAALEIAATIRVNEFLDLSHAMVKENKITALGRTAVIAYLSRGNQLPAATTNLVVTDRVWG